MDIDNIRQNKSWISRQTTNSFLQKFWYKIYSSRTVKFCFWIFLWGVLLSILLLFILNVLISEFSDLLQSFPVPGRLKGFLNRKFYFVLCKRKWMRTKSVYWLGLDFFVWFELTIFLLMFLFNSIFYEVAQSSQAVE